MIKQLNPGSEEAIKAGCTCPAEDNGHGKGIGQDKNGDKLFWTNEGLPYSFTADYEEKRINKMGNMKTWWIFGFERWGGLRPAKMWIGEYWDKCYVPLFLGIWILQKTFECSCGYIITSNKTMFRCPDCGKIKLIR